MIATVLEEKEYEFISEKVFDETECNHCNKNEDSCKF